MKTPILILKSLLLSLVFAAGAWATEKVNINTASASDPIWIACWSTWGLPRRRRSWNTAGSTARSAPRTSWPRSRASA